MFIDHKPPLSFKEQVELLISRGLIVDDKNVAEDILSRVNYYKLSGYSLHLRNKNKFIEGTTFIDIYRIYLFDKKLRSLLIDLIETIEVSIKTKVAYHIAHTYSPVGHLNFQNFDDEERHTKFLNILKTEQRHMNKNVQYIKHNVKKYGELPI